MELANRTCATGTHIAYGYCGVCLVPVVHRAGLSMGFCLALPRAASVLVLGHTLSERRGLTSTPHGFVYCKSPRGRRVGSPAGQYSSLVLRSFVPGIASPFPYRLVSAEPRALAATCPLSHPRCFPIQTTGMSTSLTCLFGVHDRTTLTRNHTLSLSLCLVTPLSGELTILPDG